MSEQIVTSTREPLIQATYATYVERNAAYWKRNLAISVFGSFSTLVSLSMLLPFLPLYVEQLGVSSSSSIMQWSGVAFGATFLGTALTAPLWGQLADRYGRKPMLVRAAIGMAVVMSLIGTASSVTELVLLRLLAGLVGGYASAATVMIGTQAPRDRSGWALGVLSMGALSGSLIGPLIGGFLPGIVGIRGSFFVAGGVIAVAALATIFFVREHFDLALDTRKSARADDASPFVVNRWLFSTLLGTAMMVLLANMSIEPIITVYIAQLGMAQDHLARTAGLVMAASAFGSVLTSSRLGALADRVGSTKVIIGCLLATAAVMLPQAFVTQWWQLAVLRGLMGMSMAGLLPAVAKQVCALVAEHRTGKALGYLQSSTYAGQVIGPLMGGQVGAWIGLGHVFYVTTALLVLCAALNTWASRRSS
jgi:DHA1 family multidrug resistance protein-like MFS transporter